MHREIMTKLFEEKIHQGDGCFLTRGALFLDARPV